MHGRDSTGAECALVSFPRKREPITTDLNFHAKLGGEIGFRARVADHGWSFHGFKTGT
jgi:hypothetical protein